MATLEIAPEKMATYRAAARERSDIDVAAWGVAHGDYVDALGVLMEIDPAFEIGFVRVEEVSAAFRDRIEAEGVEP